MRDRIYQVAKWSAIVIGALLVGFAIGLVLRSQFT